MLYALNRHFHSAMCWWINERESHTAQSLIISIVTYSASTPSTHSRLTTRWRCVKRYRTWIQPLAKLDVISIIVKRCEDGQHPRPDCMIWFTRIMKRKCCIRCWWGYRSFRLITSSQPSEKLLMMSTLWEVFLSALLWLISRISGSKKYVKIRNIMKYVELLIFRCIVCNEYYNIRRKGQQVSAYIKRTCEQHRRWRALMRN